MKNLFLMLMLLFVQLTTVQAQSQPYTPPTAVRYVDSMEGTSSVMPSRSLFVTDNTVTVGIKAQTVFPKAGRNGILIVTMYGIGNCNENNTLILLFDDGTKVKITSWNKFSCDNTYFDLTPALIKALSSKKLVKLKIRNGYTYDAFTSEVKHSMYFIHLFKSYNSGNYKVQELE